MALMNSDTAHSNDSRFTLQLGGWYAAELIGDEFPESGDLCSYSPIRVDRIEPLKSGHRRFRLSFFHANYPSGVQNKTYLLTTLHRGRKHILAKSDHEPARMLLIYPISTEWLRRHFNAQLNSRDEMLRWLNRIE